MKKLLILEVRYGAEDNKMNIRLKGLVLILLLLSFNSVVLAAEVKITALPSATAMTDDDLFVIVDDPGGSAVTKKIARSATGLVVGPASATDGYSVCFDTATGKLLKECTTQLVIGTNVQAWDEDLDTYATITPSADVQTMLGSANDAAILSNIGAVAASSVKTDNSTASHFLYVDADSQIENATTTGTGTTLVLATSPTLVTPNIGVAAATSLNGHTFTAGSSTFTGTAGQTYTFPSASGTLSRTVASGAKALATGAISSAACTAAQTDTATGTLTTDVVTASFNGDPTAVTGYIPLTTGMLTIIVYPTADTVNFRVCNNTNASITPGAITLNWRVVR